MYKRYLEALRKHKYFFKKNDSKIKYILEMSARWNESFIIPQLPKKLS